MHEDDRTPVGTDRAASRCAARVLATASAMLLLVAPTRSAGLELPGAGPRPADRYAGLLEGVRAAAPPADRAAGSTGVDAVETGAIRVPDAPPVAAASGDLGSALDHLSADEIDAARAIREGMPSGSLDRDVLTWALAMSGARGVPAADIAAAMASLADWPGQGTMATHRERALLGELSGDELVRAFGGSEPRTVEGRLDLARALARTDRARAAALLRPVWHSETLDAAGEAAVLSWGGDLLTRGDHARRMAMLVYRDRVNGAARLAPRVGGGADALVAAAAAVARRSGAETALERVPLELRDDPIYLYAKARHLRRADRQRAAARLLIAHPFGAEAAVDPGRWWDERRLLARQLLDQGDARLAYDVARGHAGGRAVDRIEAEFTAGWIALRFLNDPATATRHFERQLEIGKRALSVSRGAYWLGRARKAAGDRAGAHRAFERAARLRTTFYGQLAMERLGREGLAIRYPSPSDAERRAFAANRFVQAIARLEDAGHGRRARPLYRHLARTLPSAGQAALLTARAERAGQFQLALQMGKTALARGLDAEALAFPTGAIPADAPLSDTGRALAYAIARQESAFDREAVSGAGARGLLQLMPATAREVAGWMNVPYSKARLTSDPGYNAALGARFLTRLLDRFDGSYVLTAAAYNAGPTRAIDWRDAYGDPVGRPLDEIVDWIERIPFSETRNYVQRVMENYQVYRARLEGRPLALERDLRFGRDS